MRRVTATAPAVSIFVGMTLCVIVPILLYVTTGTVTAGSHTWLLAIIILAGLRFSYLLGLGDRRPYEMVFWLFTYVFLGMAPFVQFRLGVAPSTTPDLSPKLEAAAAMVVLAGAGAFMIGSALTHLNVAPPRSRDLSEQVAPPRSGGVIERRTNCFAIVVLLLAAYYMATLGLANLFVARADFFGLKVSAWGNNTNVTLITAAVQMGLLVGYVALVKLRTQSRDAGRTVAPFLRWAVFIALVICTNPISTPRYVFGTMLLAVLATIGAYSTVGRYRTVMVGSIVGLLTLFPLADAFRLSKDAEVSVQNPISSLTSGDFDSFGQIMNAVDYVGSQGVEYGRQLLGVILFWIPSSLWESKPGDTGALLAGYKGYEYDNLSAPFWAELFVNGGWPLLIVGMFFVGIWVRKLDGRAEIELTVSKIPGILACVVPFYLLILLRGSLLSAVANLAVVLVCAWFVTRRGLGSSPSAGQGSSRVYERKLSQ